MRYSLSASVAAAHAVPVALAAVPVALAALAVPAAAHAQARNELEEIVVTAEFREVDALDLPRSISVLDADVLETAALQHFEEVTTFVPNLNWSGEGSRARYFQLRGIGELEQYEGAPNPSVGFLIDDIDFSSLGSVATLFDVDRVEVLRGPQGTRYGANALGGLIYMRSAEPPDELDADFELTGGNDDTRAVGAAVGGPISSSAGYRVSVHHYRSDGFRRNVHLGRDDTYGRDELTTRAKLRFAPGERVDIEATALYIDLDNGYDAWAIDNGFDVYSDKPGQDAQRSVAGSVRVAADLERYDLVSITGINRTDATFSFDADWGNPELWAPVVYDFFSATERERETFNQELRLLSEPGAFANGRGEWLAGVYVLGLTESNDRLDVGILDDDVFCDPCLLDQPAESDYDARNVALFGQVDLALAERVDLTAGLRWERRSADYVDTLGNRFAPTDRMLGGELAVSFRLDDEWTTYARLARGYKAGGFNTSFAGVDFDEVDTVTPEQIEFDAESLLSLEAGVKGFWLDGRLRADVGVFAARRDDQQIKIPIQLRLGDPSSFLLLTENAEESRFRGVEASAEWQATEALTLSAALGFLDTEIEVFSLYPALEGREQAHAPNRTFAVGAEYRAGGWWGRVDVTGRDSFYFDYGHDQKSTDYAVVNLRLGREWGPWSATLWARNLLDEEYHVRGFFFANEPPDFPEKLYTRLGDPRHAGLTIEYRL